MVNHIDVLFPALQRTLSDEADQVVQQCLVVIAEIISTPESKNASPSPTAENFRIKNPYYDKFLVSLLQLFNTEKRLLNERGSFIIRLITLFLFVQ